jgi:hypothetical protein
VIHTNPIKRHLAKIHEQNEETRKLAPKEWAMMKRVENWSIFLVIAVGGSILALAIFRFIDKETMGLLLGTIIGLSFGWLSALQWAAESRAKEILETLTFTST